MKKHTIASIEINADFDEAFRFIADPATLPRWTNAFKSVNGRDAVMETPQGRVEIKLDVIRSQVHGTVDWSMTFPDGTVSVAFSRLMNAGPNLIFAIILTAPPAALEDLEGSLEQQAKIVVHEIGILRGLLES